MLSKDSLDLLLAKDLVQVEVRRHAPAPAMNIGWPSRNCRSTPNSRPLAKRFAQVSTVITPFCWQVSPAAARLRSTCN